MSTAGLVCLRCKGFELGAFLCAGVKVYETNDDEVILQLNVKYAGNPNIIVAAKAFGMKATVQVRATTGTVVASPPTLDSLGWCLQHIPLRED